MGHGLAGLPGSGWAVLAILTYYVYAPVAARCPPATCLRRRRPLKVMRNVPTTAFSFSEVKVAVRPFQRLIALDLCN